MKLFQATLKGTLAVHALNTDTFETLCGLVLDGTLERGSEVNLSGPFEGRTSGIKCPTCVATAPLVPGGLSKSERLMAILNEYREGLELEIENTNLAQEDDNEPEVDIDISPIMQAGNDEFFYLVDLKDGLAYSLTIRPTS